MQQKYWSTGNDSFMLQTILFPENSLIFLFIYVFIYLENMTIPTWEGLPMMKQPYFKFAEDYRSESLSANEATHVMQSSFLLSGLSAPCHLLSLTVVLFWSENNFTGQILESNTYV